MNTRIVDIWAAHPFNPPSPTRKCYAHRSVCLDRFYRRIEFRPVWYGVLITTIILIGASWLAMYLLSVYAGYMEVSITRFTSISYISGVVGILAVIYNYDILRGIFMSMVPLLIVYPIMLYIILREHDALSILYILDVGYNFDFQSAMFVHIPHYICLVILLLQRDTLHPTFLLLGSIFWIWVVTMTYLLLPSMHTFYFLGYSETILIVIITNCVAIGFGSFVHRRKTTPFSYVQQ